MMADGLVDSCGVLNDMITREDVLAGTIQVIATCLGEQPESITLQSSLREDLAADSLDSVEIIMALEEKFGVELAEESARGLLTVGDLVDLLEKEIMSARSSVPA